VAGFKFQVLEDKGLFFLGYHLKEILHELLVIKYLKNLSAQGAVIAELELLIYFTSVST